MMYQNVFIDLIKGPLQHTQSINVTFAPSPPEKKDIEQTAF